MSAAPLSYEQPIKAHYAEIFDRHLQRTNAQPPAGWQRAMLELPAASTQGNRTVLWKKCCG
jgi:hypothetical protein